nr:MAG TPA: hypothetical protein [Caudoviricetes sp.]
MYFGGWNRGLILSAVVRPDCFIMSRWFYCVISM